MEYLLPGGSRSGWLKKCPIAVVQWLHDLCEGLCMTAVTASSPEALPPARRCWVLFHQVSWKQLGRQEKDLAILFLNEQFFSWLLHLQVNPHFGASHSLWLSYSCLLSLWPFLGIVGVPALRHHGTAMPAIAKCFLFKGNMELHSFLLGNFVSSAPSSLPHSCSCLVIYHMSTIKCGLHPS